jgi:hypothetical protein
MFVSCDCEVSVFVERMREEDKKERLGRQYLLFTQPFVCYLTSALFLGSDLESDVLSLSYLTSVPSRIPTFVASVLAPSILVSCTRYLSSTLGFPRTPLHPPTEGETVWHQVYCTRCHKELEDRYAPGGGHWRLKSTNTTSSFLNTHVKKKHPDIPLSWKDEENALKGVPAGNSRGNSYQGLGKRSAESAGLMIEKVPSWKYRKVLSPVIKLLGSLRLTGRRLAPTLAKKSSDDCSWNL